jgi:hypothetical protein
MNLSWDLTFIQLTPRVSFPGLDIIKAIHQRFEVGNGTRAFRILRQPAAELCIDSGVFSLGARPRSLAQCPFGAQGDFLQ